MNNWKQVEEWECPECGNNDIWDEVVYCQTCRKLRNNYPLELGYLETNEAPKEEEWNQTMPGGIMMMSQVFKKPDPRRRWNGYWIYFYPSEHIPPESKPFSWIHLHFKGQIGEVELYLKNDYPDYRIVKQWGKIPDEDKTLMRKFVRDNYNDIVEKIKKQFKEEVGIDWDGTF